MPIITRLIARCARRLLPLLLFGLPLPALAQDNGQICGDRRAPGRVAACSAIIQSNTAASPADLAITYENRAEGRLSANDVAGALADIEQALRINPNYYRPYGLRALISLLQGQLQRALPDLDRALQLDPSIAANWAMRGDIYADLNDWARAAADFAEAARLDSRFEQNLAEARRMAEAQRSGGSGAGSQASQSAATPVAAASGDVFEQCVTLENLGRSGIQVMWQLRNRCQSRISLSYCLRANFEAAGDYNLCSRREYKTHSVAAGGTVHFAFNLMPDGTAMSDGRVVSNNSRLFVFGHACANDSSPGVYFEGGQFRFSHC